MKVGSLLVRAVTFALSLSAFPLASATAQAPAKGPPNIVVIMGDDVGIWNFSTYHRGMMGGSTHNIDRVAAEGALCLPTLRPSIVHGGARRLHHRADPFPHRSIDGRFTGRQTGPAGQRSDDCGIAQTVRLRRRSDRQKPSR
jgi:hypothetical protein